MRCRVVLVCRFGGGHPTRCTGLSWPARRVGDRWRASPRASRGRRPRSAPRSRVGTVIGVVVTAMFTGVVVVVVEGVDIPARRRSWSACVVGGWALGGRWRSGREGRVRCARWPGRSPIGRRRGARLLRQRNRSQRSARQRRWPCGPPTDESPNHRRSVSTVGCSAVTIAAMVASSATARRRSPARPHGRAAQRLRRWAVGDQLRTAL